MQEMIMNNLGTLTAIIFGIGAVASVVGVFKVKLAEAIGLIAQTKSLLDIVLGSLDDGQITKEEYSAIVEQAKIVERKFRILIGRKKAAELTEG